MKKISLLLILLSIFSCEKENPNDAIMQAKADQLIGTWTVDKVNFGKTLPDSLKNIVSKLDFIFPSCGNYKANKDTGGVTCNGQVEFQNNGIYNLSNSWLFNEGLYSLSIFNPGGVLNITTVQKRTKEKLSALFSGVYTVEITANELVFTQTSRSWSPSLYDVSFTAKRVK